MEGEKKEANKKITRFLLFKYTLADKSTRWEPWGESTYPVEKDDGDALFKV